MELKRYERIGFIFAVVITAGYSNVSAFVCVSRHSSAPFMPLAELHSNNDQTNTRRPQTTHLSRHHLRLHAENRKRPTTATAASSRSSKQWSSTTRPRLSSSPKSPTFSTSSPSPTTATQEHRRLNRELTQCQTAKELLHTMQSTKSLTKIACGGHLNSVNFSTLLHRLGRFSSSFSSSSPTNNNNNRDSTSVRASILVDPRFALIVAALGEALVLNDGNSDNENTQPLFFASRELSNIAWAIAKLKIAPPTSAMPYLNDETQEERVVVLDACQAIRQQVLDFASQRQQQQQSTQQQDSTITASRSPQWQQQQQQPWIPSVSRVAGYILDVISHRLLHHADHNNNDENRRNNDQNKYNFQMQEYANLLWAWATASRVDEAVFRVVIAQMIAKQSRHLNEQQRQGGREQQQEASSSLLLRPQEWSNSIWAAATAQVYSAELLEFVASLLLTQTSTTSQHFADDFKPQELANTVWGVATLLSTASSAGTTPTSISSSISSSLGATGAVGAAALEILRHMARSACKRAGDFKTQELSNTLWALATLGLGLTPTSDSALNNYVVLVSESPEEDFAIMQQTATAILEAALQKTAKFRSQELNNMAWALARLMDPEHVRQSPLIQQVLQGIGEQLCDPKRLVSSQDIATSLWSLATLEFAADDLKSRNRIYRGIVSRMTPDKVRRAKPQELSNTLWALTTAEIQVQDQDSFDTTLVPATVRPVVRDQVTAVFGMAAQELMRRSYDFKPQEMKDVLWSFSKIGIRHPGLFQATAIHLVGSDADCGDAGTKSGARGLVGFSPQGLGNLAWAFARQAQLACELQDRYPGTSNLLQCNGRLAVYLATFFDFGELLVHRLFRAIAKASVEEHDNLGKLKPQDLSNIAWTSAVLGLSYTDFMEKGIYGFRQRMSRFIQGETHGMNYFKGQEVANLLWSLATLNIPVGDLLECVTPYMEKICQNDKGQITTASIARILKRQELANIAWSCAVFGKYPKKLMKLLYSGLIGTGKNQDPTLLTKVHEDDGLQSQAIMSLVYVQAAMDLEGKSGSLQLPPDFPEGWPQPTSTQQNGLTGMTESLIELNLSTSKIQRAVSAAFTRIGFEHVEEHVITMEEMAKQGINLAPKPLEILSIDIANLKDRIAIEVDGPAHFISDIDEVHQKVGYAKLINGKLEYQFRWDGVRNHINGPTALKHRLLSLLGWKVINLPFWEWYAMGGDQVAEDDYCRRLLQ